MGSARNMVLKYFHKISKKNSEIFSSAVGRAPVNVLQQYSRFIKQRVFLGPNKRAQAMEV